MQGSNPGLLHCRSVFYHLSHQGSVQFSRSVVSHSLRPHGLQHTGPPCPSSTPRVYSNSCLLSQWYHPTISSSVVHFFSHLQSLPASGYFQMSQFFTSGGQSIGISASISVLPMNIQDWSPLGWTGWVSSQFKGLLRVSSPRLSVIYNLHASHKYHRLPDLLAPSPQLGKLPGLSPLPSFTSLSLQGKRVALWLFFSWARIQDNDRSLVCFLCLRNHCPALLEAQNLQAIVSWTFFCFSVSQSRW